MPRKIQAKQIDALVGQARWSSNVTLPTASSMDVTSLFSSQTSGGSDTQAGVITTAPSNKIFLRVAGSGQSVKDVTGKTSVFGRLTFAASAWTLSFYTLVNGTETPYSFEATPATEGTTPAGTAVNLRYCEVVQLANATPTMIVNAGEGIDEYDASSPTAHQHLIEQLTVTTNGQTDFTLAQTPKDPLDVEVTVNGIYYDSGVDYTLSGTTLTWAATMANGGFDLATTDKVVAHYAYAG